MTLKSRLKPTIFIATAPQIISREDAEALRNTELYVPRDRLPPPEEDAFYMEDLIGLNALLPDGAPYGRVRAVQEFGAGVMLELMSVPGTDSTQMIAFTRAQVPEIDIAAGYLTVRPESDETASREDGARSI